MQKLQAFPITPSDVIVDRTGELFSKTEVKGLTLTADVFCGDILDADTGALYAAGGKTPIINLSDMTAGDKKTLVVVDRHVVISDAFLRAADEAAKAEALKALQETGVIRLTNNSKYYKFA
ncbi:hypothetical protein [Serratia quinivorans]|uniref:hypothetical protein n=1 Tax=Serratia quinivorans TaxID=137545 RepID=UPI00217AB508|nr:hypothetical protein [Serratia quinivorans]CAI0895882.1 Uncharacterised protein [Serratia quinivorans]CAI2019101.1 Uncharacterised protein [Serratia quinivorans]